MGMTSSTSHPPSRRRQITLAASWRLTAELVRRYPSRFTVIETHPATGQYDCLTLLDRDRASGLERIDLNREGSTFVWNREQQQGWHWAWRGCWPEMVATADPRELLDRLSQHAGLAPVKHVLVPIRRSFLIGSSRLS